MANTTGTQNTAVGYQSALAVSTGSSNTLLGYQAAAGSITASNNVAIGTQTSVGSTGGNNTVVGTAASTAGHSGSIVIGHNALASGPNQFVVGSVGTISGTVTAAVAPQTKTWDVIINGVAQKILLA